MSHLHQSSLAAILMAVLLCLGLAFDNQALASQESTNDSQKALHSYLPLQMHDYGYIEPVGVLDSSFGDNGVLFTPIADYGEIFDLVIQPDGKMVAIGRVAGETDWDIGLVRYDQDGSLDTSFGEDGRVITNLIGAEEPQAIVLQPDGKIVVAGFTIGEIPTSKSFLVVRYLPDGSLDTSFSGDGWVTFSFLGDLNIGKDLVLQPDGKILVSGNTFSSYLDREIALARLNPDGSLDASFGIDGKVITDVHDHSDDYAEAILLQEDGAIIVAASSWINGTFTLALARYQPDGNLDSSFDEDGLAMMDFKLMVASALDAQLQSDGKIAVAFSICNGLDQDVGLARFNPDGSLDTSFGEAGLATADWGCDEYVSAVVLQPNGKIIPAGTVICNSNSAYILARFNPDGSRDTDFGSYGQVLTDVGYEDYARSMALQPDGKILLGGSGWYGFTLVFALVRYE